MKRKEKILLLLMIFPLLGAGLRPLDLKLNGNLLEAPLLEEEGEFYMPIKAFSQLTSMQLTERSDGNLILFRDNIFIKFNLNSNTYYLNGKEYTWKEAPFKKGREIYIPYRIILDYMNYNYQLDEEGLSITGGAYDISLSYQQNRQRVDFVDAKISYAIPYFWTRISPNSFYHQETDTSLEVMVFPLEDARLEDLMEKRLKEKDLAGYKELSSKNFHVQGKKALQQGYEKGSSYLGISYLTLETRLVETTFKSQGSPLASAINLEDEILSSVHFNAYTIDEMEEHYVELGPFYAMKTQLETPVYSNKLVSNHLLLKGQIHPSVRKLHAQVKRGKRSFDYSFDVDEDGSFTARIPIPFGLGFHSLTLSLAQEEETQPGDSLDFFTDGRALMKFSVLNTNLNEGLYLSYSDQVPSQHERIKELAQEVKDIDYDYEKAQALLLALGENFKAGSIKDPEEALEAGKLGRQSAALVYGALLRNSGVPTRIISNRSLSLYGVEVLSNGIWHKIDPYGYLRDPSSSLAYMSLAQDYFGKYYIELDY